MMVCVLMFRDTVVGVFSTMQLAKEYATWESRKFLIEHYPASACDEGVADRVESEYRFRTFDIQTKL